MRFPFFKRVVPRKERAYNEQLQQLTTLDSYQDHPFSGKTKEMVDAFQIQLTSLLQRLGEAEKKDLRYFQSDLTDIRLASENLQTAFEQAFKRWEEQARQIEQTVEASVRFIDEVRFYPPEYVFSINQLKGHLIDIEENKEKDPLGEEPAYEELRKKVESDIAAYRQLHEETVDMLRQIEKKKEHMNQSESNLIIETKEKLFRHLQMGKLEWARSELQQLSDAYESWG